MVSRGVSIQTKIVVPFVCLFLAAPLLTGLAIMRVSSRLVEDGWRRQVSDAAELLGKGTLPATKGMIEKMKMFVDAEIVLVRPDGRGPVSTLDPEDAASLQQALTAAGFDPSRALSAGKDRSPAGASLPLTLSGTPHVAYYEVVVPADSEARPELLVFFLVPQKTIGDAKRQAAMPIVTVSAVSLIFVLIVGFFIAAKITRPVRRLAEVTREIAAGRLDKRAEITTRDELAELAASFNLMVDSLRDSQEKLIRSERLAAIGELAAGVAHEIRNPLTAIRMNVQMLRQESAGEIVDPLLEEIDRLEIAIEGLLTFAQPTEPAFEPTDLREILDSALALMARQFQHAHITVETEYDDALGPIQADPGKLKQVAINLLVNAMNAMVRGGAVTVTTRAEVRDEKKRAVLEVRDTGAGMDPEMGDRIFEPFYTTRAKGTGLGLAITRQIVLEHGGTIEYESPIEDDRGTVFRVVLPVTFAAAE